MALEGVELNPGTGGATVATDTVGGLDYQVIKLAVGADGSASLVSGSDPLPVSGTVTANAGTDLNTSALALESGGNLDAIAASAAAIETAVGGTLAVSGPLTDTELRAAPVVVDLGANNDVTVTGSVTVDGTVTANLGAVDNAVLDSIDAAVNGTLAVSGPLTDAELRANPVVVDLGSNNDVTVTGTVDLGATDNAVLDAIAASLALIDNAIATGNELQVDVVAALPAGNNNIGDVDVASVSGNVTVVQGTATNLKVQAENYQGGSAVAAGNPLQVTLANGSVPSHAVTNAGTFAVQVDGAALTALQLLDDCIVADDAQFTAGTTKLSMAGFVADEGSTDSVNEDDAGAARMTLDRKQIVTNYAHAAAGGATPYKNLDVDETEDDVKTSAGKVFWLHAINLSNGVRYLKFYNATAANVTVGTTTPVLTFPIPTFADTNGAGFTIHFGDVGLQFDTAICIAATTGLADNNSGAPGASEVVVNLGYL